MPFDQAVNQAVDDLMVQTQKLPAFPREALNKSRGRDRPAARKRQRPADRGHARGRASASSGACRRGFKQFTVSPVQHTPRSHNAQYVLNGTLVRYKDATDGRYRLNLALTEIKSGVRDRPVGGAHQRCRARHPAHRLLPRQPGQRQGPRRRGLHPRTAETQPGQAADALYLERLPTATVLQEATAGLRGRPHERCARALRSCSAKRPDGQQLRIYSGMYLTQAAAGPHGRCREDLRHRSRAWALETNNLRRQVPVQAGFDRLPVRPQDQQRLSDVAAPDRARGWRRSIPAWWSTRPHQPHRARRRPTGGSSLSRADQRQGHAGGRGAAAVEESCARRVLAIARTSWARAPTMRAMRSIVASNSGGKADRRWRLAGGEEAPCR